MIMFVIYSLVLHISYTRSSRRREKKGQVSRMKSMKLKISGRKWAAPFALVLAASGALAGISGGSG
jgi:hypothetical protein